MPQTPSRPHILLICTDHWGGPLLGAAGHPVVMTPTLDQLARCGVLYTQAYSSCPSCIPARRQLMTGMSPRVNRLRTYQEGVSFPEVPTLAQCCRDAGYQAYGVGKLHVYPQRNRIGFDDVLVEDQGRHQLRDVPDGDGDDYELFLADQGYGGQEYASGMPHNDFLTRTWHLPEHCHPVNWAARELTRFIRRRDPRRPGFWYLSFSAPHPPLTPLPAYMDLYRDVPLIEPAHGAWSDDFGAWPYHLKRLSNPDSLAMARARPPAIELARRAYYAIMTHIDHQIRLVLGYLRENGLLDNTAVVFTADHGHMAGEHGLWCMTPFYDMSARIPLIVVPPAGEERLVPGTRDDRLAEFGDLMPTLLELAGIPVPDQVDRLSLLGAERRAHLYGEHGEGTAAMRMIRDPRYKLIYYPVGNRLQLFDMQADPRETRDLVLEGTHQDTVERLQRLLIEELYGDDLEWVEDDRLVGLPEPPYLPAPDRNLRGQRGLRFM